VRELVGDRPGWSKQRARRQQAEQPGFAAVKMKTTFITISCSTQVVIVAFPDPYTTLSPIGGSAPPTLGSSSGERRPLHRRRRI
jgi:hypothetical protein